MDGLVDELSVIRWAKTVNASGVVERTVQVVAASISGRLASRSVRTGSMASAETHGWDVVAVLDYTSALQQVTTE